MGLECQAPRKYSTIANSRRRMSVAGRAKRTGCNPQLWNAPNVKN
ncbi:MAG: hypothetical protein Hyperionvirus3_172 [Hyperionvirus sp.]|uniref:Uncharacterized protein n=1 Tax=Hyperionvirus sp. TaxID=2487770 RepID=A0A3G5A6Z5_9VIRU|nr:MAG: hypothetical protein Hyperionvirus3_172 [Hyperionvirus sp.]